jgi:hypothetical protein
MPPNKVALYTYRAVMLPLRMLSIEPFALSSDMINA